MKISITFLLFFTAGLAFSQTTGPAGFPPDASYEIGFSPGGTTLNLVMEVIENAKTSLRIACYEFSNRDIEHALIDASHRGVDVRVVADAKENRGHYSLIRYLASAGIPVRLCSAFAITHDKQIVADDNTVELGSFNFSAAAVYHNSEDCVVLHNCPQAAAICLEHWEYLWSVSRNF